MVVVELLSAGLSPDIEPGAVPGDSPVEKDSWPVMVEGPPIFLPLRAINMVRPSLDAIMFLPLESVIVEPEFEVIVQPVGNSWPSSAMVTRSAGTLTLTCNL